MPEPILELQQAWWPTPPPGASARDVAHHRAALDKETSMQTRSVCLGPAPVLTTALYERFMSRGAVDHGDRVLPALRLGSGGREGPKG